MPTEPERTGPATGGACHPLGASGRGCGRVPDPPFRAIVWTIILLLDGELAARRLIEVSAIESYLKGTGPARDEDYFRLFDLASLELWLRARTR